VDNSISTAFSRELSTSYPQLIHRFSTFESSKNRGALGAAKRLGSLGLSAQTARGPLARFLLMSRVARTNGARAVGIVLASVAQGPLSRLARGLSGQSTLEGRLSRPEFGWPCLELASNLS